MNPLGHAANVGATIAFVAFFAAFVLTLRPRRTFTFAAAGLFTLGTWVSLGILARNFFVMGTIAYGASDSGSPNTAASFWFLLPVTLIVYALAAPVLLWPSIPQATAMLYGTILNLAFVVLVSALTIFQVYETSHGYMLADVLRWLVYALLWFRIRQSYQHASDSTAV
jgi:hypothetical protein